MYVITGATGNTGKVISESLLAAGRNPKDITRATLYFASEESSWTTGVILPVDGGVMAL